MGRGGEKRKQFPPLPPLPIHFSFLLSYKLSRWTRAETLATQAMGKHRKPNQMWGNPTSNELQPYDIQSKFEINNKTYK